MSEIGGWVSAQNRTGTDSSHEGIRQGFHCAELVVRYFNRGAAGGSAYWSGCEFSSGDAGRIERAGGYVVFEIFCDLPRPAASRDPGEITGGGGFDADFWIVRAEREQYLAEFA